MSNIIRARLPAISVPDAKEAALLSVVIPLLVPGGPVTIQWLAYVKNPAAGTTKQTGRVRRSTLTGTTLDLIDDLSKIAQNAANLYGALSPALDTPGLPATIVYLLTLECVGAHGPSTGIDAFMFVTYD